MTPLPCLLFVGGCLMDNDTTSPIFIYYLKYQCLLGTNDTMNTDINITTADITTGIAPPPYIQVEGATTDPQVSPLRTFKVYGGLHIGFGVACCIISAINIGIHIYNNYMVFLIFDIVSFICSGWVRQHVTHLHFLISKKRIYRVNLKSPYSISLRDRYN